MVLQKLRQNKILFILLVGFFTSCAHITGIYFPIQYKIKKIFDTSCFPTRLRVYKVKPDLEEKTLSEYPILIDKEYKILKWTTFKNLPLKTQTRIKKYLIRSKEDSVVCGSNSMKYVKYLDKILKCLDGNKLYFAAVYTILYDDYYGNQPFYEVVLFYDPKEGILYRISIIHDF